MMPNLIKFSNKRYLVLKFLSNRDGLSTTYQAISVEVKMNRHDILRIVNELKEEEFIQQVAKCTYNITPLGKRVIKTIESEL